MRRYILLVLLLSMHYVARGQTKFDYEYWFDNDRSTLRQGSSSTEKWQLDADVEGLSNSIHTIHFQVKDANGVRSSPVTRYFVKIPPSTNAGTFRYWFDDDESSGQRSISAGKAVMLDVSQLDDGIHLLHVQTDGIVPSSPRTCYFIKQPQTEGVEYMTLVCSIDNESFKQERVENSGGTLLWNLDVGNLKQGFHHIQIVAITPSGAATSAYHAIFMRVASAQELSGMKFYYFIDDETLNVREGQFTSGGVHFDLDVSQLTDGLHRIGYFFSDGKENTTSMQSQYFWKTPVGGNGITSYQYWLNEKSGKDDIHEVKLSEPTSPFKLISLLPVESQPLRSCCFAFRIEDGQPVIYAKNEIHIRFTEATGRFSDVSKLFVDESVKQEVTNVTLLNPGERKTSGRPEENAIKWYKVTAVRGDSLAFKTDYPCTIQLFSPSGEELYNVSGPDAVRFGGSYAPEDGTYYLALHDVTAQYGTTLTVDYQHIDKYAVLSYTPEEIGVTVGYIQISLDGNGFDKLQNASLLNGDVEIQPSKITVNSKSSAVLQFALTGKEVTGAYDIVLHFNDEGQEEMLTLEEAIRFTEANFGDIAITVEPTRRAGFPYPVIVKVRNTGNVSKMYVPFNLAASFSLTGQMPTNSLSPCSWTSMYTMNFDVLSTPETDVEEDSGYSPYTISDNLIGTGLPGVVLHGFIPELGPNETKEYILGFVGGAHQKFNLYAWTGIPLNQSTESNTSETNIYSVWDYLAELKTDQNPAEARRIRKKIPAPDVIDDINTVMDVADAIDENVGEAARITVGIGLTIGGIEQGLRMRSIRAFTENDDFAAEVLADYEVDIRRSVVTPRQITHLAGWDWLQTLLGLQDCQARNETTATGEPVQPASIDIYAPGDPNDIFGYTAESGSKYMKEGTTDVYYTIEFENDPEIANASAHTIVVKDTLDKSRFDLSTFAATGVKIGSVEMKLDGEKNFSKKTMDLRPAIDVIAQVSLSLDEQQGIATWTIESLDPMSLEPTEDAMQGVLPVNVNGNGQGELMFDIKLKPGMTEGETVSNRAGIVFDQEGTIMTPSWVNTVDATDPESHVENVAMACDDSVSVKVTATDALSKPWRYDLYVQEGTSGIWQRKAANIPVDSLLRVKVAEGIDYGFYTIVTDSAGNVEQKEAQREFTFEVFGSQIDTNTKIDLAVGWNWISHNQQEPLTVDALKPASARMQSQTEDLYEDTHFGWMGDLTELLPTQMYKVQMGGPLSVQLSGRLFNAGFRSVPLYSGWNWLGYPVANTMSPAEALQKLEAEEGDMLIGQDGLTTYSEGQWTGTLLEMVPGLGYMYRSASDKNLFYNATAQASSRRANSQLSTLNSQLPEGWTVDKRKYPNVMGVIAVLMQDETAVEAGQWVIGAFCGAECRGISKEVSGTLMMNVYGQGGEPIRFYAMNCETGEVLPVAETEPFEANVLGTMLQPYALHIGEPTGISQTEDGRWMTDDAVYDLQGRKVDGMQMKKGIYVTSNRNRSKTQKVIRR